MNKGILLPLAAAIMLAAAGPALAAPPAHPRTAASPAAPNAERSTLGTFRSFTAGDRQLKLSSGGTYTVAAGVDVSALHSGDKVRIGWRMDAGKRVADTVQKQ